MLLLQKLQNFGQLRSISFSDGWNVFSLKNGIDQKLLQKFSIWIFHARKNIVFFGINMIKTPNQLKKMTIFPKKKKFSSTSKGDTYCLLKMNRTDIEPAILKEGPIMGFTKFTTNGGL
jgi:hypothetical protein